MEDIDVKPSTSNCNGENDDDSDSAGVPEGEYEVEVVRGKKVMNGTVFYCLKWKGWPEEDNTWEPLENLSCHDLIQQYEDGVADKIERLKETHRNVSPKPKITMKLQLEPAKKEPVATKPSVFDNSMFRRPGTLKVTSDMIIKKPEPKKEPEQPKKKPVQRKLDLRYHFETGSIMDKILTVCELNPGELVFYVEYKDGKKELLPNEIMKYKFPQELIAYYEENVKFVAFDYRSLIPDAMREASKEALNSDSESDSDSSSSSSSSSSPTTS
ncbi:heterochromatin protein 1-like isoform X2 [Leptotrombidium deliense]|uniref:Heterochromatin protein 1-like isoform X2 n=1 Tax=Leptotrombidium deliense TaxID=299467 RepID=A0A443SV76_9ACAR|nr:heterochromatin protein 1-like isoform X2 [Leptotrombidium deliense]